MGLLRWLCAPMQPGLGVPSMPPLPTVQDRVDSLPKLLRITSGLLVGRGFIEAARTTHEAALEIESLRRECRRLRRKLKKARKVKQ